ncbi:MAG: hypothetical protein BWY85_00443 [Firmicutes bacterium ADurb.Bin506]|nr:MAG: hypothetical protein BWY85_00443 [Firmicutes bacterium ADurb.Bin506]
MSGVKGLLRKKLPTVYRSKIKQGDWEVQGATKSGHIWIVHVPTGRRITAPGSSSCSRAEKNLLAVMSRYEKGDYRR